MSERITPGRVQVRNAFGDWLDAVAISEPEGTHKDGRKIHDFPVVWVKTDPYDEPLPWPLEDVRLPGEDRTPEAQDHG